MRTAIDVLKSYDVAHTCLDTSDVVAQSNACSSHFEVRWA